MSAIVGIVAVTAGALSAAPVWAGTHSTAAGAVAAPTGGDSGGASQASDPRAAARATARSSGRAVTVDALTTGTSTTVAEPDGSFSTTTSALPTRMKNAAGSWTAIDPTLRRDADGSIGTTATPNALRLSGGGSGPVITVTDTSGHAMALSLPGNLPVPTLSGASATYAGVLPGVDLVVTADPSGGFGEVFTLHDAAAAASAEKLRFTTKLTGLTLHQDLNGQLSAADTASGKTVWTAPATEMWDSATGPAPTVAAGSPESVPSSAATSSSDGPGTAAHKAKLPVSLDAGGLTVSGDPAQLGGTPAWPVYLDPSWTLPYQSGGTQASSEVAQGSPCDGSPTWNPTHYLRVGYNDYSSCIGAYRAYYQIDTSNVLASNYIIRSATLKINEVWSALNSCNQGSEAISIYTTSPINSGTDWDNKPANGQLITTKTINTVGGTSPCTGGVVAGDFDVSSGIAQVRSGNWANWTFAMVGNETAGSHSNEGFNNNPSINTVYDVKPNTPSSTVASPAPVRSDGTVAQGCDGNIVGWMGISNLNGQNAATLSAWASSAVSQAQLYGQFEFYDHTTNTELFPGNQNSNTVGGSGGTVSVTTPALTDGHLYTWQVNANDGYYTSDTAHYCGFSVDEVAPANPQIASTVFPPVGSGQNSTVYNNQAGTFTLTSADGATKSGTGSPSGLKGFNYQLDNAPSVFTALAESGTTSGTATITLTPTNWGVHTLSVQAVDNAGNVSAKIPYTFYVPWNPATKVAPGDLNNDGVPDLLGTTSSGDLVMYPGDTDLSMTPTTLGTAATNPILKGNGWGSYLITHRGSFSNQGVDDVWAYDPAGKGLFLVKNSGTAPFQNVGNVTSVTKAGVATDAYNDPYLSADSQSTACATTSTGSCASYDNTDWSTVTQVLAPGDLYATDPVANYDNGYSGLLTVEGGSLWYYRGQGSPNYLNVAVQLGTSGWDGMTLIAPGMVGGKPALWARDKSTGNLYQYTITFDTQGWPKNLGTPSSGTLVGTAGTFTLAAYPNLLSPGDLQGTGYPDLYAVDSHGTLVEFPGQSTAGGASPLSMTGIPVTTTSWATTSTTLEEQLVVLPPVADQWKLNDGSGTTAADSGSTGGNPATVTGASQFAPGGYGLFAGTSGENMATAAKVVDTGTSFSVAAWARLDDTAHAYAVAAQNGNTTYGFWLGYDHNLNAWALTTVQADANVTNWYSAAGAPGSAQTGVWTHLVGEYNAVTGKLSLYVNGVLQTTRQDAWPTPFTAPGKFMIGNSMANGAIGSGFLGGIADVRLYQQALSPDQAAWLYQNTGFVKPTSTVYSVSTPNNLISNDGTANTSCSNDPAHPAVSTSTTPTLKANVSGTGVRADFEIADLTNPQTAPPLTFGSAASAGTVASTSTITSPALTAGHTYQWTVRGDNGQASISKVHYTCYLQIMPTGQTAAAATGAVGAFLDNTLYPATSGEVDWSGPLTTLKWQTDGNLVLTKKNGAVLWSSNTSGNSGAVLALQNDGNLVVYKTMPLNSSSGALFGAVLWSSNTAGQGAMDLVVQTDGNGVLNGPSSSVFSMNGNVWSLDNIAENKCLDSNASGSLYTNPCQSGNQYQEWTVIDMGDGTRAFKDVATGLCLDGNSSTLYTLTCNFGGYQRWAPTWTGTGWILKSQGSGLVLDCNASGTPYPNAQNGGNYQRWV